MRTLRSLWLEISTPAPDYAAALSVQSGSNAPMAQLAPTLARPSSNSLLILGSSSPSLWPPEFWSHQHFNAGNIPARYLALRAAGRKFKDLRKLYGADEDVKKGGSQMEYDDEFRGYRRRWLLRCRSSSNTRPSLPFDPMVREERS